MGLVDREEWRRLQPILDEAFSIPPDQRREWLARACAGDSRLRALVQRLLEADAAPGGVLDIPSGAFLQHALSEMADRPGAPATDISGRTQAPATSGGELLPGTVLADRYRIVSLLGRGGMGEVYRADDLRLGQPVALKFVADHLRRHPDALARLTREVRLARHVSHPNVCRVFDLVEADGRSFLAMEYVDGEDLASLVRRIGRLPEGKAIDVARQICAGLEAAHRQGVLHRDLKPANVMVDGRGQVRITDFGLAVSAADEGRDSGAGTPAYMAPEQREGRAATVRSDIYALGLVLYEVFTGQRPFRASSVEELQRLADESSPTPPSRLIDGFNPAVERAILSCLEHDPELRPPSAQAVAAALPGRDPISAALAAGVTPSPELVAASGPDGAVAPSRAALVLCATFMMLVLLLLLNDRAHVVNWTPWTRSADVLEDGARTILQRLGHDTPAADRARFVDLLHPGYVVYVRTHDRTPERWDKLRQSGQLAAAFLYRQSANYMVPRNWYGVATTVDPPVRAGDAIVATDLRGRLIYLQVQPSLAASPLESAPPDWSLLFAAAGLEMSDYSPTTPTRLPRVAADARAAWTGVLPDFGLYPVRIEAAAHRGKPVFFELVMPWDPYWDPSQRRKQPPTVLPRLSFLMTAIWPVMILVLAAVLVTRNWVSGRGDRRGALRVAALVFSLAFTTWLIGAHHVPDPAGEWFLLLMGTGKALTDALAAWALYLALEPYARRVHPQYLVSWTRLLHGRVRDPLVGRDILVGAALSTLLIAFWAQLFVVIPHALNVSAPPPPMFPPGSFPYLYLFGGPPTQALLGGREMLAQIPAALLLAFGVVMLFGMVLLSLRFLLRRTWAALLAFGLLVLGWPVGFSEYSLIGFACSYAGTAAHVWVLRYGLVSALTFWFCVILWLNFPVTMNWEAHYLGTGFVAVLIIGAVALYGAVTAARPRLAFRAT